MAYRGAPLHDKAFALTDQVYSQWETADIKWSASTATSKTGWLLCNGQAVSRTQYKRLFDDLGVTFGAGDASTTFNVPDIAGKVCVGISATDADFDTLGETGGAKTVTLTGAQSGVPTHTHPRTGELIVTSGGGVWTWTAGTHQVTADTAVAANTAANAAESHNNMQPSIVLRAWVKT